MPSQASACLGEIFLVGLLGLHQRAGASVRTQPRIDGEHQPGAGIGGDEVDHAVGHAGPEHVLVLVLVGHDENQVGVRSEIELAHAQPSQSDDHELVARGI